MKAPNFDYLRPKDVTEALAALKRDGARLLAGGQSLGPMLNLRLARPRLLVDVTRLEALQRIDDIGAAWRIGAGVTHSRLEDMRGRMPGADMVCEVAAGIAYRSVRNKGTIGGSLAHADPAGDWPLAVAAFGATLRLVGPRGSRTIAADAFMRSAFTTELADDEMIEAIDVPKLSAAGRWGYYKFCRKTGEYAEAAAAALLDPERRLSAIFVGALPGAPRPLPSLARIAAEQGLGAATQERVETAVAEAAPGLDAIERRMQSAAVRRALAKAFGA
jgi:carbon-monoxide dehydrogenase medium subunit